MPNKSTLMPIPLGRLDPACRSAIFEGVSEFIISFGDISSSLASEGFDSMKSGFPQLLQNFKFSAT